MELIVCFLGGIIVGYFRGVLSGYGTKVREEDKSKLFNVEVFKEKGIYLFYAMEDGKFLFQHDDIKLGAQRLIEDHTDKKVVLSLDESCHG